MVSTPEDITDDSPSLLMTQTTVKKPSARKSLHFSPTYYMLKIELLSIVLEIQNHNADPLNMEVACGKILKTEKGIQKPMIRLKTSFKHR